MGSIPIDAVEFAKARTKTKEEEEDNLERFGKELFKDWKYTEQLASEGAIGESLTEWVRQIGGTLVIMGTHGHGGNGRIFGTNAWHIIKESDVPVLLIPPGVRYTGINHIVFGAQGRNSELSAIRLVARIANKLNARLTVLHINKSVLSRDFEREMFDGFRRKLFTQMPVTSFNIRCVGSENIHEGLNAFCNSSDANWLVMAHRQRTIFERLFMRSPSVTKKMSVKAQIPLLALPSKIDSSLPDRWDFGQGTGPVQEIKLLEPAWDS
jgi:nucleotide-binding universal stress UspA family protein